MQMESGLDTGPMIAKVRIPIGDDDTAASIHDQLAQLSATLIRDRLADYLTGGSACHATGSQQSHLCRQNFKVRWPNSLAPNRRSNCSSDSRLYALARYLCAFAYHSKSLLKILRAQIAEGSGTPGQVLPNQSGQFEVATGQGIIFTSIQREGGRPMSGADFLNGCSLPPGAILK